jgi:hypothetical protein
MSRLTNGVGFGAAETGKNDSDPLNASKELILNDSFSFE